VRTVALAVALAAAPGAIRAAEPPLPPTPADLVGARGLALAAYRGLATGNDGMFTNAATLAVRRRYSVELQYLLDRQGPVTAWQWFQASVVDSETTAVTGGFAYTRVVDGASSGNLYHVPLAGNVAGGLYAGLTGKYLDLRGPVRIQAATLDLGLYWQASSLVGFGAAAYNVIPIGKDADAPLGWGAGLHVGDDRRFNVAVDWRADEERRGQVTHSFAAGAELLVAELVPLRAGWLRDETRGASWWAAGVGVLVGTVAAIDLSYRQGIERPDDRGAAAAVKLFIQTQ
jgi:F0F1-type ATP synthase assembly protein I